MLETHEAAKSVAQLLLQPADQVNLGNFKLNVSGPPEDIRIEWSRVELEIKEHALDWAS
jgi:hypothetical protein